MSAEDHTLDPDDVRRDMIALLTAEAHGDFDLLTSYIKDLEPARAKAVLLVLTKYVMWMVRMTEQDPVQMVQDAALYWSGGEPDEET